MEKIIEKGLRSELLALLQGGNAHMGFEDAIAEFPPDHINRKPTRLPYSFWHLLEHMRIVQWDILQFVLDPDHVSPPYPDGYWPAEDKKGEQEDWDRTIRGFRKDLLKLQELVSNPKTDFFGPIPHAKEYTVFREILLAADHNAFHLGEFVILRRIMGIPADEI
jgi:hypothetical protein